MSERRIVITDLDDTLVAGKGFDLLIETLSRPSRVRRLALLALQPVSWVLMILPPCRAAAASLRLWAATVGLADDTVREAIRGVVARAVPVDQARPGSALAEIAGHLRAGRRLVVVTAGTRPLAEATCEALGIQAEIVAAPWRRRCGGMTVDAWVSGRLKRHVIAPLLPIDVAYGDSVTDLAMLRHATARRLVAPGPMTRLLAHALVRPVKIVERIS